MPERPDLASRRLVARRARFRCEYCQTPAAVSPSPFAAEHILPKSQGGGHELENLAFSCPGCNGHKAAKTVAIDPATRKMVSLFNPRVQDWREHFQWTAGASRVEGITPWGRATVEALQLNRSGLENLRRLLVIARVHPPASV